MYSLYKHQTHVLILVLISFVLFTDMYLMRVIAVAHLMTETVTTQLN